MDYKKELDTIEREVSKNKEEKIKLEERKRNLQEEKEKIIAQLKEEGIKEEELQDRIMDLEVEIEQGIEKCKEVLK